MEAAEKILSGLQSFLSDILSHLTVCGKSGNFEMTF